MRSVFHPLAAITAISAAAALIIAAFHPALADNLSPTQAAAAAAAAATDTNQLTGVPAEMKLKFVLWVTLAIVAFGLLVLGALAFLFGRVFHGRTEEFVRIFAITLVIVASLVLIVAGYADSQIAPAFGLFGSIIGYIFGRSDGGRSMANPTATPTPGATP